MNYYRQNEQHLIENYEQAKADNFIGWVIHHRLGLTLDGQNACQKADLIRHNMYYERPYFELIYMRSKEHARLHAIGEANSMYNKSSWYKCTPEEKLERSARQRASSKGHKNPKSMRDKLSKIRSEANKKRHWFTNGIVNKFVEQCPIGFVKGKKKKQK